MNKIILKILQTCDLTYLAEVMIQYTKIFEEILKKSVSEVRDNPKAFYLLIKEKTYVLLCFEIMFRRLKSDTIKIHVSQKVYGEQA